MAKNGFDAVVVGGGLVGMAIACGLVREGLSVAVCDGDDAAWRASRGNFGLVWVQGKGGRCLPYAQWSLNSSERWQSFAAQLLKETGIDVGFERPGGVELCETPAQLHEAEAVLASLREQDAGLDYQVWEPAALQRHIPAASPLLAGGLYSRHDGHANPLFTLRALHAAFQLHGGVYLPHHPVREVRPVAGRFAIETAQQTLDAGRVVLAAGLGNTTLAPMVGLQAPISPLRGQIMVTEKLAPFLAYPTLVVRQTREGSVMMGDSAEPVGFDDGISSPVMADIARRAQTAFPMLAHARVVRSWAALRIMTPDGLPVYQASTEYPGAFIAICHSGVTLAAAHTDIIAPWIAGQPAPASLDVFSARRFDNRVAAPLRAGSSDMVSANTSAKVQSNIDQQGETSDV